jgi:hypothetical protein
MSIKYIEVCPGKEVKSKAKYNRAERKIARQIEITLKNIRAKKKETINDYEHAKMKVSVYNSKIGFKYNVGGRF